MRDIYSLEAPTGKFLKFESGGTYRVRMFGEPIEFIDTYDDGTTSQKFASLVIYRDKATKTNEVRVMSFGWTIQKALKALVKDPDWGVPTEFDILIAAKGEGLKREYSLVPKPKSDLTEEENALIDACDWDLQEAVKRDDKKARPGAAASAPKADEYDPFADE